MTQQLNNQITDAEHDAARDIVLEMVCTEPSLDAPTLRKWATRYPDHARILYDVAAHLKLAEYLPEPPDVEPSAARRERANAARRRVEAERKGQN